MKPFRALVDHHIELFNAAVRSGDWSPFLGTFTDDAVMDFSDLPLGPYRGRDAIETAYATQPPEDTLSVDCVDETAPATTRIRFSWDHGGTGTMIIEWREDRVAGLEIAFD